MWYFAYFVVVEVYKSTKSACAASRREMKCRFENNSYRQNGSCKDLRDIDAGMAPTLPGGTCSLLWNFRRLRPDTVGLCRIIRRHLCPLLPTTATYSTTEIEMVDGSHGEE